MKTEEMLREIKRLLLRKRIYAIEKAIHLIWEQGEKDQISKAVNFLCSDYKNDKELTAFTNIDFGRHQKIQQVYLLPFTKYQSTQASICFTEFGRNTISRLLSSR